MKSREDREALAKIFGWLIGVGWVSVPQTKSVDQAGFFPRLSQQDRFLVTWKAPNFTPLRTTVAFLACRRRPLVTQYFRCLPFGKSVCSHGGLSRSPLAIFGTLSPGHSIADPSPCCHRHDGASLRVCVRERQIRASGESFAAAIQQPIFFETLYYLARLHALSPHQGSPDR